MFWTTGGILIQKPAETGAIPLSVDVTKVISQTSDNEIRFGVFTLPLSQAATEEGRQKTF